MIGITLIIAILTILIAARHPTGPNTVSYDDPLGLLISIGLVIILFMPIYLLTLSTRPMFKILCTICLLHLFINSRLGLFGFISNRSHVSRTTFGDDHRW